MGTPPGGRVTRPALLQKPPLPMSKELPSGIQAATQRLQDGQVTENILPDEDGRTIAAAAGQVGMASLGAIAIVGEAVLQSTRQVAKQTAVVMANVVQHRYGSSAGQAVRDAADTTGNIICTMANVAVFQGRALTKMVAKTTGKNHLLGKLDDTDIPSVKEDSVITNEFGNSIGT